MVLLILKIGHPHVLVDSYNCNFDISSHSHMQAGRDLRFISLSMIGCLCGGALVLSVMAFLDLLGCT